jgi:hypothetical protein
MLNKHHIEAILKANGIPATAPDEEIRSVLISARFNENDVDTALVVLKENVVTNKPHVDTLHKVFHSDDRLTPAEISSLLGVQADFSEVVEPSREVAKTSQKRSMMMAMALAFIIVALGVTYLTQAEAKPIPHAISHTE